MKHRLYQSYIPNLLNRKFHRKSIISLYQDTSQENQKSFTNLNPGIGASGHLPLAKTLWTQIVKNGDIVIDATCGNGFDSYSMAQLALDNHKKGTLYCIDIQPLAIEATKNTLASLPNYSQLSDQIKYCCTSHEIFPKEIQNNSVSLIVYNLGYLPKKGRDAWSIDVGELTNTSSTLASLSSALSLIKINGLISITGYRGINHVGGLEECNAIHQFTSALDPSYWRVYSHEPINRVHSPILFTLYKIK